MNQEDKELELSQELELPLKQLELAIHIANKAHVNQFRRDGKTPYMQHIHSVVDRTRVLASKLENSDSERLHLLSVAYLHDVIEDHGDIYTPAKLAELGVDADIIAGVQALTRDENDSYERFIEGIARYGKRWIIVKIADMLANLADDPSLKQIDRYTAGIQYLLCRTTQNAIKHS